MCMCYVTALHLWYCKRQRSRVGKGVVFTTTLIARSGGSTHTWVTCLRPWISCLNTLIILLGGFKQAENSVKNLKKSTGTLERWKLLYWVGVRSNEQVWIRPTTKHLIAIKRARIIWKVASDAVRWQEHKYATNKQKSTMSLRHSAAQHFVCHGRCNSTLLKIIIRAINLQLAIYLLRNTLKNLKINRYMLMRI